MSVTLRLGFLYVNDLSKKVLLIKTTSLSTTKIHITLTKPLKIWYEVGIKYRATYYNYPKLNRGFEALNNFIQ